MRYRALSSDGDYTFGQGNANFLINSPEAVAQSVLTRLKLAQGEWFLDVNEGTPYATQILGKTTQSQRDAAIRSRILGTLGVNSILQYSSVVVDRIYNVTATIDTIFGPTTVTTSL
jgi:hypothetical protein